MPQVLIVDSGEALELASAKLVALGGLISGVIKIA